MLSDESFTRLYDQLTKQEHDWIVGIVHHGYSLIRARAGRVETAKLKQQRLIRLQHRRYIGTNLGRKFVKRLLEYEAVMKELSQ